jgi:hypothetical protein
MYLSPPSFVVNRVRWFRAKADVERWEEEERILRKEFEFTYHTFKFLSEAWIKTITTRSDAAPGYVAYAHERAEMFEKMANDCSAAFEQTTGEQLVCALDEYVDFWYSRIDDLNEVTGLPRGILWSDRRTTLMGAQICSV